MADPLYIAANLSGVLDATKKTIQGLEKLWALRKANEKFLVVMNSISALGTILRLVEISLRSVADKQQDLSIRDSLRDIDGLRYQASSTLAELDDLTRGKLQKGSKGPAHGPSIPQVSKRAWLFHEKKLEVLQSKIVRITQSLSVALAALNTVQIATNHSDSLHRITHAIQQISIVQTSRPVDVLETQTEAPETLDGQLNEVVGQISAQLNSSQQVAADDGAGVGVEIEEISVQASSNDDHTAMARTSSDLASGVHHNSSLVSITTTLGMESCRDFCHCQCHIQSSFKTPQWTRNLIGTFMLHTNGSILLNRRPCNYRSCHRSGFTTALFTFYAPSWMLSRAFCMTATRNEITGTNASISISMPSVIPSEDVLWYWIREDQVEIVKGLFKQRKISPYDVNEYGRSLLQRAIQGGSLQTSTLLLKCEADMFHRDDFGSPAFLDGVDNAFDMRNPSHSEYRKIFGTSDVIEQLELTNLHRIILNITSADLQAQLELSIEDIDTQDAIGRTPLMWAAWTRNSNAVRVLIDAGADVNKADVSQNTALHLAVYSESEESFSILLGAGAHAAAADVGKIQPIHIISKYSQGAGMIKALISHGAVANARTIMGSTPLHELADEHRDLRNNIKVLLEHGANIDAINNGGWRPVMTACGYSSENFECLIDMGARLDLGAPNGENILHRAAYAGSMEHWEILTNAANRGRLIGIDPEARDHDGDDVWYFLGEPRDKTYFGNRLGKEVERDALSKLVDAVKAANEAHCNDTKEYRIPGSFE